jgi:Rieske Fe-S protein
VSFHGDVILVNDASGLAALGARCPHLGCRVNRHEAGELVCPCHGSRFDLAGTRHAGPASGDLRRLTIHRTQPDQVDVELSG